MLKKITCFLLMGLSCSVFGGQHNKIDTLGVSKAGQFVALEEYGYKPSNHSYFVTIKIINVWTEEYVGSQFEVEESALQPLNLNLARAKAKKLASEELKKFNISG
jgi:hypothetical protein